MPMTETMDLALAESSPRRSLTSEWKVLARAESVAAGRAWMPVGLGTRTPSEAAVLDGPSAAAPSSAGAASTTVAATSTPARISPPAGSMLATASEFVITIWVSRLLALRPTSSRSNSISGSPTATRWPALTLGEKPSPTRRTVSSPMCMRISRPSSLRTVTACADGCTSTTSPATGETRRLPSGSMEIPSPTILRANTGSGT